MADLVCVVPLWRRVANIDRVRVSFRDATPDGRLLFVASRDDHGVVDALTERRAGLPDWALDDGSTVLWLDGPGGEPGDYARKINAGYRASTEPFIFTGADDLLFRPGWREAALREMTSPSYPQRGGGFPYGVGVVGTVDLCNDRTMRGEHSTHSLVARWYADEGACVDQDHVIYHEGYWHEYCDDELVRTAMSRGAWAHAAESVVEHVHMLRDASLDDETYRHGRRASRLSRRLFLRRRALWGDARSLRTIAR